ncbi:hypothetical protein LCGC14_3137990, partial [marine sediment metagenome]
ESQLLETGGPLIASMLANFLLPGSGPFVAAGTSAALKATDPLG